MSGSSRSAISSRIRSAASRRGCAKRSRPAARYLLPRILANPDGAHPYCETTLRRQLLLWEQECDFREEDGTPVHLTAHRFRHTIATRMINEHVPEIAVQQMLDHSSPAMTRVYAKIHNATLRARLSTATRSGSTSAARSSRSIRPGR